MKELIKVKFLLFVSQSIMMLYAKMLRYDADGKHVMKPHLYEAIIEQVSEGEEICDQLFDAYIEHKELNKIKRHVKLLELRLNTYKLRMKLYEVVDDITNR